MPLLPFGRRGYRRGFRSSVGKRGPGDRLALTPSYLLVYGDDENVVRQTLHGVVIEREDGWVSIFRGKETILRIREEHLKSIESIPS